MAFDGNKQRPPGKPILRLDRTLWLPLGVVLALVIFFMRLWLPESPRWLMTHGRAQEAQRVIEGIERRFEEDLS